MAETDEQWTSRGNIRIERNRPISCIKGTSREYGISTVIPQIVNEIKNIIRIGRPSSRVQESGFLFPDSPAISRSMHISANRSRIVFSGGRIWSPTENGSVLSSPCSPEETYGSLPSDLETGSTRGTLTILTTGKVHTTSCDDPIGAYTPEHLKEKIIITTLAREIASKHEIDVDIPEWVGAVEFQYDSGKKMAAGAYMIPDAHPMTELVNEDRQDQEIILMKLSRIIKAFMDADFIHPQLHFGNVLYYRRDDDTFGIVITDWLGAYKINNHNNKIQYVKQISKHISPKNLAKFYMLTRPLKIATAFFQRDLSRERAQNPNIPFSESLLYNLHRAFYPYVKGFYPNISEIQFTDYLKKNKAIDKIIQIYSEIMFPDRRGPNMVLIERARILNQLMTQFIPKLAEAMVSAIAEELVTKKGLYRLNERKRKKEKKKKIVNYVLGCDEERIKCL